MQLFVTDSMLRLSVGPESRAVCTAATTGREDGQARPASFCPGDFHMNQPPISMAATLRRLPFASVVASVLEKKTKTEFPKKLTIRDGCKSEQLLTGIGVRAKRLLRLKDVNLYSLGLYVNECEAQRALSHHKGLPVDEVVVSQSFYNDLLEPSVDKSMRLVVAHGLRNEQFWGAMAERLEPPLQEAGAEEVLQRFKQCFSGVHFKPGTQVQFMCSSGTLCTTVNGDKKACIKSPELCTELFRIYLGPDAVSPEAKAAFGHGLAEMLNGDTTQEA